MKERPVPGALIIYRIKILAYALHILKRVTSLQAVGTIVLPRQSMQPTDLQVTLIRDVVPQLLLESWLMESVEIGGQAEQLLLVHL